MAASRLFMSLPDFGELIHLVLKLRVDRGELLVGGLKLLLGGFELFVGALKLLVDRLQLFVGRFELLVCGLQLFDGGLKVFPGRLEILFELLDFRRLSSFPLGPRAGVHLPERAYGRLVFKHDKHQPRRGLALFRKGARR